MKLNFQISIDDDYDLQYIEDDIIDTAARQLITEVMANRYEHYGKTFKEKLEEKVKEILLNTMDADFKSEVKEQISIELAKKFERTKQYKELKDAYSIDSDSVIKSGLKDLVAEMVSEEIKRKFKN